MQRALSRRASSNAMSIAEALFSSSDGPPPKARLDWLGDELDDYLIHAGRRARLLMRLAIWTVTWLIPLRFLRLPPFSRLPLTQRVRLLHRAERSLLSVAFLAVKAILCTLYFEHPEAAREIGWDPDPMGSSP